MEPFGKNESWLILSSIERSIKKKVEKNGIPLKDWDIQIYRGVLTGYNKAFIIDEKRKNELILEDPKSAEIIRPILRGRDIDRYGYKFADLYLICTFPAKNLNIDDFPAIKKYLLSFGKRKLSQSGEKNIDGIQGNNARKRTTNQWFETQDSISYWDDFNKPKIMFSEIVQSPRFYFDEDKHFIPDVTAVIIYGKNTRSLKYLTDWLNSSIVGKIFKLFYSGGGLGDTGYRYKKKFLENLPIPPYSETKIENIDVIKDYKFTKKEVEWLLNH